MVFDWRRGPAPLPPHRGRGAGQSGPEMTASNSLQCAAMPGQMFSQASDRVCGGCRPLRSDALGKRRQVQALHRRLVAMVDAVQNGLGQKGAGDADIFANGHDVAPEPAQERRGLL